MEFVRCKRCHRYLTKPESRKRGYGYICWKKIKISYSEPKEEPILMRLFG